MTFDDLDEELPIVEDTEAYAEDVDLDELLDDDLTLEDEDEQEDDELLSDPYLQELAKFLEDQQHNLDNAGALE